MYSLRLGIKSNHPSHHTHKKDKDTFEKKNKTCYEIQIKRWSKVELQFVLCAERYD